MSEAVDTRVVEAKFDSSQFEKGVDRTVKKLDELKKSLTFKETGKTVSDLTSKINDASEKVSNTLDTLNYRITSFMGMLRQKLLGGIADEIVGAIFKIKNAFTGLVSSLSTGQIGSGMQRYTDMMTSVRTMVANGTSTDMAYKMIERLNEYADQTSYSIDQLVNLMSQLKTGGANIADAEKMVEGLSNAAAAAGVNAQRASTAYYNFAQAYQKGAMLSQDWQSFQNIGMSGVKMNQAILDAAESVGTLKKELNGTYSTVNKVDKQIKTTGADAKGITAENMGQKLSSRWFNKAVMEKFTKDMYYFESIGREELEKYTDLEEKINEGKANAEDLDKLLEKNGLSRFAYEAFRAGQEARSFTDVMNTLKDAISRGWSDSFQYIFGKLDDAKVFFTWLTENKLADAIYAVGTFRNAVLKQWSEGGGRTDLMEGLKELDEIIGDILGNFTIFSSDEATVERRAKNLGQALVESTRKLRVFVHDIRAWLNEEDGNKVKRIERIANAFHTFGTILGGVAKALQIGFRFIKSVFKLLEPVFEAFGKALAKIGERIKNVIDPDKSNNEGSAYKALENGLGNLLKVAEPVASILTTVVDVIGDVAAFFAEMAASSFIGNLSFISDALGFIIDLVGGKSKQAENGEGVLDKIKNGIIALGDACKGAIGAVGEFFSSLFEDLRELFGFSNEGKNGDLEEGGFFDHLLNFFNTNTFVTSVKDWVNQAIIDIGDFIKTLPERIVNLGNTLWTTINGWLWNDKYSEEKYNSILNHGGASAANQYREQMKTPFHKWIDRVAKTVREFVASIPGKLLDLIGSGFDLITTVVNSIFNLFIGDNTTYSDAESKKAAEETDKKMNSGFENIKNVIVNFIRDIPNQILALFKTIGKFGINLVSKFWNFVDELIFGKKVGIKTITDPKTKQKKNVTIRYKTGFSKWLDDTLKSIKEWFSNPKKFEELWNTIDEFFFGKKVKVSSTNSEVGGSTEYTERIKSGFSKWLDDTVTNVRDWIVNNGLEIIGNLWNIILDFIFGRKANPGEVDPETNLQYAPNARVKEGLIYWLSNIVSNVGNWLVNDLPRYISTIWNTVIDFIFGRKVSEAEIGTPKPDSGEKYAPNDRVKSGFSAWLDNIANGLKVWITDLPKTIGDIWNKVIDFIFGRKVSEAEIGTPVPNSTDKTYAPNDRVKSGFSAWLDDVATCIANWFSDLPAKVTAIWQKVLDLVFGTSVDGSKLTDPPTPNSTDSTEAQNASVINGIISWILGIAGSISTLLSETLPDALSKLWDEVVKLLFDNTQINNANKISDGKPSESSDYAPTKSVLQGFLDWIDNLIQNFNKWSSVFNAKVKILWTKVLKTVFGNANKDADFSQALIDLDAELGNDPEKDPLHSLAKQYESIFNSEGETATALEATAGSFVETAGHNIGKELSNLPTYILEGIDFSLGLFGDLANSIKGWFDDKNAEKLLKESSEQLAEEILSDSKVDPKGESTKNDNAFLATIISIGQKIANLITTTIPGILSGAWTYLTETSGLTQDIAGIFSGIKWEDVEKEINNIGTKIAEFIRSLPEKIRAAVTTVKGIFTKKPIIDVKETRKSFMPAIRDFTPDYWKVNKLKNTITGDLNDAKDDVIEGFDIWGTVKEIGKAIIDAMVALGPDILNGINSVLSWIGEKLDWLSGIMESKPSDQKLGDALVEDLEKSGDTDKAGLVSALTNIGETIKNLMVNIIPRFIKNGITEIINSVPNLINEIGKAFGSEGEVTQEAEQGFEQGITRTLDSELKPMFASGIGEGGSYTPGGAEALLNEWEEVNKEAETILMDRQEYIEMLNQSIQMENNTVNSLTPGVTDQDREDAKKKAAEYEAYLEYAKSLTSETIALTEDMAPIGAGASTKSIKGAKDGVEMMGDLFGHLESFLANPGTQSLGKLAMYAIIITKLRDILSISDELEAPGWTAKWEAVKYAILTVAGIIGYLVYLNQFGTEDQINRVEGLFDRIGGLFDKLGNFIKTLSGIIGTTGMLSAFFNWRTAKAGAGAATAAGATGAKGFFGNALGGALKLFGNIVAIGLGVAVTSDAVAEGFEDASASTAAAFENLGVGIDDLIKTLEGLASISGKIDEAKASITRIREIFTELYNLFNINAGPSGFITEMDYNNVDPKEVKDMQKKLEEEKKQTDQYIDKFDDILFNFTKLSANVSLFKNAVSTSADQNTTGVTDAIAVILSMKDDMAAFASFATSTEFEDFKLALMSLGGALQLYSFSDFSDSVLSESPDENIIDNAVELLSKIFGNKQLESLISTLSTNEIGDPIELVKNAENITIFAGALTSIAKACAEITDDTSGNINGLIETIQDIKPKDEEGKGITALSTQFAEIGNALSVFAVSTSSLNDDNLASAERALKMLSNLGISLNKFPNSSEFAKFFSGDKSITDFGIGIQNLGQNLKEFFTSINSIKHDSKGIEQEKANLEFSILAINAITNVLYRIGELTEVNGFGSYLKDVKDSLVEGGIPYILGLGKDIMTFINDINDYSTISADQKEINFDFVYKSLEAFNMLVDIVANKFDDSISMQVRLERVQHALFGEGPRDSSPLGHGGMLEYLQMFLAGIVFIMKGENIEMDLNTMGIVVSALADLAREFVQLCMEVNGIQWTNFGGMATVVEDPMGKLIPAIEAINEGYDIIVEFLEHAKSFDKEGLSVAKDFFTALHELAQTFYYFNFTGSSGASMMDLGLQNLLNFDWVTLGTIKDMLLENLKLDSLDPLSVDDSYKLTIMPVIEITDDFVNSANNIRQMLGIDPIITVGQGDTFGYSIPEGESMHFDIPQTTKDLLSGIALARKDYSEDLSKILDKVTEASTGISHFSDNLGKIKFYVDGTEFAGIIYPYIAVEAGRSEQVGRVGINE